MELSLDNPGFSATQDSSLVTSQESATLPPPSVPGSSSAPSSGDSSLCN